LLAEAFERADILSLEVDTEEILVLGDWAWEWHNEWSTRRLRASGEVRTNYIRGAQMFRRQPNGDWKIARYIANVIPLDEDVDAHKEQIRRQSHAISARRYEDRRQ
jgi:ketosteroid isomerase-like protein